VTINLLSLLESFYDAVPRRGATVEEHGPLRLFVRDASIWPYYARPSSAAATVTVDDVDAVRARQREIGAPESFEWVHDLAPSLTEAARRSGLAVELCPLLVLDGDPAPPPDGVRTRVLDADDADLALAEAVAAVGFGAAIGTRTGVQGVRERDEVAAAMDPARLLRLRAMLRDGVVNRVVATADDGPAGPLASGGYQHAVDVAEVVGVATLPSARRRGLGAAVAGALAAAALERGLGTVFLSAQDEDVARVYERVGFRRVGTAGLAAAPQPGDEPAGS
jgi:GNAT superfamily N-acetyltransferase